MRGPMSAQPPDLSRLRIERGGTNAVGGGRGGWIAFVLLLLAAAGYVAWSEGLLGASDERPRVTLGRVVRAGEIVARTGTSANGYVVARRRAALSTDIQGRIVELLVDEGDAVVRGQLVARLDTRQLEAALAQARADEESARVVAERLHLDRERYASLLPTGDIDEAEYDRVRLEHEGAVAHLAAMEARVDEIEVMLDKSAVYAPFDGVITAKNAEVGEVVSALGASGPDSRGAVATLVDFSTLEVQVELAQSSLKAARIGASANIFLDAWPEHRYRGRVRQIWPTANRQKATVEVRIEFLERDDRILPEMGVRVVFVDDEPSDPDPGDDAPRVLVPDAALVRDGSATWVFVSVEGRAARQDVELGGAPSGGLVPVTAGLIGGESVVLSPPASLLDGDEIRTDGEP